MHTAWRRGGVMVLVVLGFAVGCGRSEKKAGEKLAEKLIEAQTGGKASVKVSGDKFSMKSEHGEVHGGGDTALPADFPDDVYVDKQAKILVTMRHPNSFMLSLQSASPVAAVNDAYVREMGAMGWSEVSRMEAGEQRNVTFKKENRQATIIITKNSEATQIILTVSEREG